MSFSIETAIAHMENLVLGQVAGAVHPIPAGRFVLADDRSELESYREGGATRRPFYIALDASDDHLPEGGQENVAGTLIHSAHRVSLVVPYLAGGGSMGKADQRGLRALQATHGRWFRDSLTYTPNYDVLDDADGNGVMNVVAGTARTVTPPRPARRRPGSRISIRVYPFTLMVQENWTQQPQEP